jgi:hypothetical protein
LVHCLVGAGDNRYVLGDLLAVDRHPAGRHAPLSPLAAAHGIVFFAWLLMFLVQTPVKSMYGPPPFCKAKNEKMTEKVCANVSGHYLE